MAGGNIGTTVAALAGVPAVGAVLLAVAGQVFMMTAGPYGITHRQPVCPETAQTCVVVAGLQNDVRYGFGANGSVFGLDMEDDITESLVGRLDEIVGDEVTIIKYPREVPMPASGAETDRAIEQMMSRAGEYAQASGADLLVVGRAVGDNISIRFVDPRRAEPPASFTMSLDQEEDRATLATRFRQALAAAGAQVTPISTTPEPPAVVTDTTRRPRTGASAGDPISPPITSQVIGPSTVPAALPPIAPPTPARLTNPVWLERPNAADFSRYYPPRALDREQGALVRLSCLVDADGRIACTVASEDPPGWGFGEAALRISRHFRMAPATRDGEPTSGGRIEVPIRFSVAG